MKIGKRIKRLESLLAELCLHTTGQSIKFTKDLDKLTGLEIAELKILNLIEEKEFVTACANADISKFGEWQGDYQGAMRKINREIGLLFSSEESCK